jgi:D-aminoacyl-tRNA deacylase
MVHYLKESTGFASDGRSPRHKNAQLYVAPGSLLTLEDLDRAYPNARSFIFLSKHRSDSQIPTLTCHCTGNFSDNPYGGNPREIAISFPSLQKGYLRAITAGRNRVPEYDVIIEATHHGPTSLKKPVLFVELGSSEKQWGDSNAAGVMCDTLLGMLDNGIERCGKVGIALGGTHYPTKFNELLLVSEFGLAAVASKHNLEAIDEQMLDQMITKSVEKVTHIVVDSKGLGSQRDRIIKMAEKTGLEIHKV